MPCTVVVRITRFAAFLSNVMHFGADWLEVVCKVWIVS